MEKRRGVIAAGWLQRCFSSPYLFHSKRLPLARPSRCCRPDISDVETFAKKPRFFISNGALGDKKQRIRVLDYGADSATCLFTGNVPAGQYSLFVIAGSGKNKQQTDVTESFHVRSPLICISSLEMIKTGDDLTVGGVYFGNKPKVTLEFLHNGKVKKKRCGTERKRLMNMDYRHKPAVMDCLSSQSYLSVKVPKGITERDGVSMTLQSPHGTVPQEFNVQSSQTDAPDARVEMKVPSVNERVFKVLVTNDYFAALTQGGLTKDFQTTYQDAEGNPLTDLIRGEYEVKVLGLSGDLEGYAWSTVIYFQPIRKIFSPFRPEETHKKKLFHYAAEHCLRKFWDPFAGYFLIPAENYGGGTYTISRRYRPQNWAEGVNFLTDATYGTAASAMITFVLYNLDRNGYTQKLEVASVLKANLMASKRPHFMYYDIGEPSLWYVPADGSGEKVELEGGLQDFQLGGLS